MKTFEEAIKTITVDEDTLLNGEQTWSEELKNSKALEGIVSRGTWILLEGIIMSGMLCLTSILYTVFVGGMLTGIEMEKADLPTNTLLWSCLRCGYEYDKVDAGSGPFKCTHCPEIGGSACL